MSLAVAAVVVIFAVLAVGLAFVAIRRQDPQPPPMPAHDVEDEDPEERSARHRTLEERGTELLERRVALDMRRGTLGGNTEVYEAFEALERRLRAGEITEDEFEAEKLRLLGG